MKRERNPEDLPSDAAVFLAPDSMRGVVMLGVIAFTVMCLRRIRD
jgi:hypothetical protein